MPKYFGVFCKNCGSYEVKIYTNANEDVVMECQICNVAEAVEEIAI